MTRGQPTRNRVHAHPGVAANDEIAIQRRHGRKAPLYRRSRQPGGTVRQADNVLGADTTPALLRDETHHVPSRHLRRVLTDNVEEHLQIMRIRFDRVRPGTTANELQELVDQIMTTR